ncbi:MAG: response regulator transcription factor [Pseudomonadota bacterium]
MAEAPHLLVVDDDDRLRSLLKRFLSTGGYRVTTAHDAETARGMMDGLDFDLVVLDVMMPGEDGFSFLERLRKTSQLPVIVLTARGLVSDRIAGLKHGADDYLSKPFEPEELSLRIASILRRSERDAVPEKIRLSGLVFDPVRGDLRSGDKRVHLTEAERQLLSLLAEHVGEPVTRQDLAARASNGLERSIDVQVTRLRRKIEPDPREPIHLQTVRGVGYRLMPD